MNVSETWAYTGGDRCADFFTQTLRAFQPSISEQAHVLEIGCAEFDWMTPARKSWPSMTITGIDWRGSDIPGTTKGDVMTHDYAPWSFDWIVSVSAIEHIGLTHYDKDPKDDLGDTMAMRNAYRWLKPGGLMYLDVPWDVEQAYEVFGTSHRVYDDATVQSRLTGVAPFRERWRGWAAWPDTLHLLPSVPTVPKRDGTKRGFYLIGLWLQKPSQEVH